MEFNQTIRDLQSRFDEAQQAASALAEGLQAAADVQAERPASAPPRSLHDVCQVAAGVNCG